LGDVAGRTTYGEKRTTEGRALKKLTTALTKKVKQRETKSERTGGRLTSQRDKGKRRNRSGILEKRDFNRGPRGNEALRKYY